MESKNWMPLEVGVLAYFTSRGVDDLACRDILALKSGRKPIEAIRAKVQEIQRIPGLWVGRPSRFDTQAVDVWLRSLQLHKLPLVTTFTLEEKSIVAAVRSHFLSS